MGSAASQGSGQLVGSNCIGHHMFVFYFSVLVTVPLSQPTRSRTSFSSSFPVSLREVGGWAVLLSLGVKLQQ